jgi:hypothetical protein
MRRAWLIPMGGAVLAPLVTFWPMVAYRYPHLGLPAYHAAQGIDFWSSQAFWLVGLGVVAAMIGASDRYLGLAVAFAGLSIFWRGLRTDPTHSVMLALGAVMLVALRRTPVTWHAPIKTMLACLGGFQLLYVLQQWAGYDLLWGPLFGGKIDPTKVPVQPLGTLGTVDAAGAYLAITAPLMPWWALPVVAAAVWYGHSAGALGALVAGLSVKVGLRYGWRHPFAIAMYAVGAGGFYWLLKVKSATTIAARLEIWQFVGGAFISDRPDLTTSTARHLFGLGLGGWAQHVPAAQIQQRVVPYNELWREAHSEPFQWVVETGLVGLVLLCLWLYAHRAMFLHPVWGGSIAALSVNSLTFFPLHVVQIALVALIIVGLATATPLPVLSSTPSPEPPEWGVET